jgi:hypothetical protein
MKGERLAKIQGMCFEAQRARTRIVLSLQEKSIVGKLVPARYGCGKQKPMDILVAT